MRLLLVEDDAMIGQSVCKGLTHLGWVVDWVRDGRAAELALEHDAFDAVMLDLGLPRKSGLEVLEAQRKKGNNLPVLIVTARDDVADRVAGLDAGADDYLVKPFSLDELAARLRALTRRHADRMGSVLAVGKLRLNSATHEATFAEQSLSLSAREFAVLEALLDRPGVVLSRAQLEGKIYGWGGEVESNTIEVYIHMLRRKLGPHFIKTVRGVGYMVPKDT